MYIYKNKETKFYPTWCFMQQVQSSGINLIAFTISSHSSNVRAVLLIHGFELYL